MGWIVFAIALLLIVAGTWLRKAGSWNRRCHSQDVVGLEVIAGHVMLGGLISIFANKLARRG